MSETSDNAPRNRRERRAAAKESRQTGGARATADSIPLSQPARSRTKAKTLYEIAAEREAARTGRRAPFSTARDEVGEDGEPAVVTINPDGTLSGPDGEPLPNAMATRIKASMMEGDSGSTGELAATALTADDAPLAESLLYTFSLTMLHFTLSILVARQYNMASEIAWAEVAWQSASLSPALFVCVYLLHPRATSWWAQGAFLLAGVTAGCWLVRATNRYGYLAVMKNAPGVGTLWVWSVLESRVELAILSAAAVAVYFWMGGYSLFG